MEQVERATHDDHEQVALIAREIPARIREADLVAVDVSRAVATFETTFSLIGTGAGRAVNIRRAASKIDGLVLAPGQVLSFNDVVGPRSIENGFTLAPEIQGDELQTGVGGGTCQVSSTLHAASLFATLEIVDRQSHSRLSSYTKPGLDATVSYPTTDLKIRNTLSFPVMIHAWLPKPTSVRVDLLGGDPVAAVEYAYGMGHAEDFVRRVYVKPELPPGKRIKRQKGARGYGVTSIVTMRFPGGRVEERRYFSGYRPSPEVFWVSPGYDEREMPPLPEHAKGIEQRGAHREEGDFYAM
jgi:vancomycin resistance protein YoaR